MDIITLAPGQRPPEGADFIRIDRLPTGKHNVSGCVRMDRDVIVSDGRCETFEEAKLVGTFWAEDRGAKILHVEVPDA